jgi:hypothetical protein
MEKQQARSFNFLVPGVGLEEFSTPENAIFDLSGLLEIIWMEYS